MPKRGSNTPTQERNRPERRGPGGDRGSIEAQFARTRPPKPVHDQEPLPQDINRKGVPERPAPEGAVKLGKEEESAPAKDARHEPPAKEGKGIDNDRYSKSDSDHPRVKQPGKAEMPA